MAYGRWPRYVPVAKRRAKAEKELKKMQKQGKIIEPIESTKAHKIAKTFWGESWCEHLGKFSDYDNRLPRGRTYVRNGSVCHLAISKGQVEAIVSGSSLYHINIKIKPIAKVKWNRVKKSCAGQIGSMLELLQGHLSHHVMEIVTDQKSGLFPGSSEIKLACDCPDWAGMCKHLAAVLYGVGARLDKQPELLFLLRGVDHEELVDTELDVQAATSPSNKRRRIARQDLGSIFDVDMEAPSKPRKSKATTPTRKKSPKKRVAKKQAVNDKAATKTKTVKTKGIKKRTIKKVKTKKPPFKATSASVKRLRKSFSMTPIEFANLVGVSQTCIINWEHQRGKLNLQQRTKDALDKTSCLTLNQAKRRLKTRLAKN
jgi:uncharacterized Zn finger protein